MVLAAREGAREGAMLAFDNCFRAEFRAFMEDYFGVLTKEDAAALLGCSERTIEELWKAQVLTRDTGLGERMPRASLPDILAALRAGRIKAHRFKPKLGELPQLPTKAA